MGWFVVHHALLAEGESAEEVDVVRVLALVGLGLPHHAALAAASGVEGVAQGLCEHAHVRERRGGAGGELHPLFCCERDRASESTMSEGVSE